MKKISVLLTLVICVTIGGVYAAWSYAGAAIKQPVDTTVSHGMASITSTEIGDLRIVNNSLLVKVDQLNDDYDAYLNVTGQITVQFTPGAGAEPEIYENAIPVYASVYVENADANLYNGSPIYVSTGNKIPVTWEKQEDDGSFIATLGGEQVLQLFELGDDFQLKSETEYQAFHALEGKLTLNIKFEHDAGTGAEE